MDCLENIIGISRSTCECFTDGLNAGAEAPAEGALPWYQLSTSGVYLDELEGIARLRAVQDSAECADEIGTIFKAAIQQATARLNTDLLSMAGDRFKSQRDRFDGYMGGRSFSRDVLVPGAERGGLILKPQEIVDGQLSLRGIMIAVNTTGVLDVMIHRYFPESGVTEYVDTIEAVNTTAGRMVQATFAEPMILPLYDNMEGAVEYFFSYPMTVSSAKDNGLDCGCGTRGRLFKKYAELEGFTMSGAGIDPALMEMSTASRRAQGMGLVLVGELKCVASGLVCRMAADSDKYSRVLPYALQYLAGAIVQTEVLNSGNVNLGTMVDRETMIMYREEFKREYQERLTWLTQNTNPAVSGCFVCSDSRMTVAQIRV